MSRKTINLIGIVLACLSTVLMESWGNLQVYLETYFSYGISVEAVYIKFVPVVMLISLVLSMSFMNMLLKSVYKHFTLPVLLIVLGVGYLCIGSVGSVLLLYLVIMLLTMLDRLISSISRNTGFILYSNRKSFITKTIKVCQCFGVVFWNIGMTYIINPDNNTLQSPAIPEELIKTIPRFFTTFFTFCLFTAICVYLSTDKTVFIKEPNSVSLSDSYQTSVYSGINVKREGMIKAIELEEFFMKKDDPKLLTLDEESDDIRKSVYSLKAKTKQKGVEESFLQEEWVNPVKYTKLEERKQKLINMNFLGDLESIMTESDHLPIFSPKKQQKKGRLNSKSLVSSPLNNHQPLLELTPAFKIEIDTPKNTITEINLTERQVIKLFILKRQFLAIYLSSVLRNVFFLYILNNFKDIFLHNNLDDHFITNWNCIALLLSIPIIITSRQIINQISLFTVIFLTHLFSIIIILLFLYYPTSKLSFIIIIILFKFTHTINETTEEKTLYHNYKNLIVQRLLIYSTSNKIISMALSLLIELITNSTPYYHRTMFIHLFIQTMGLFITLFKIT